MLSRLHGYGIMSDKTVQTWAHLLVNGFELLQRLFAGDGVDQDEGVAFGDGQALHGGELVAPRGVRDLEGAHAFVAADHLAVGVLHRGDVGVPEGALDETQDQGALPDSPCPEHHHAIVVALLRHSGPFRLESVSHLRARKCILVCTETRTTELNLKIRQQDVKKNNPEAHV